MLSPEYLANCAEDVTRLYVQLEIDITCDIAERVARMGRYSETSMWQAHKLREAIAAYSMYRQLVSEYKEASQSGIREIFLSGAEEAVIIDDRIYRAAGMHPSSIASSRALMEVLSAGLQKTNGVMDNLTMTTARDASHAVQNALDRAYMQVASGAFSFDQAARGVINELGQKGYTCYNYASGARTSLEAATRRALITGLNQTTARLQLTRAEEMHTNLVEVSSHAGARPTHAVWQGQVYQLSGNSLKYKNFYDATDYGTGDGLCGWNCYHNFYPYIEGISTPSFERNPARRLGISNDELYAQTQQQRALERKVRESRRECQTLDAAAKAASGELAKKLRGDFTSASVKLKQRESRLHDYCKRTGLPYDSTRVSTYGFGRSASAKAVWAERQTRSLTLTTTYGKISLSERVPAQRSLTNLTARLWYQQHDARIPDLIDRSLPIEDRARQACELRNMFRTMTRDFMKDQETRKILDIEHPNKTFEQLLDHKMTEKHMTREEAVLDILNTSTKTNTKVNVRLGLEE